jgi:hypothetical protein
MNGTDFVGIVFIVIGLLLLIPTVYVGWVFVFAVGLLVSLGIFIVIEMGELFRNPEDVPPELLSDEKRATSLERVTRDPPPLPTLNVSPTGKV